MLTLCCNVGRLRGGVAALCQTSSRDTPCSVASTLHIDSVRDGCWKSVPQLISLASFRSWPARHRQRKLDGAPQHLAFVQWSQAAEASTSAGGGADSANATGINPLLQVPTRKPAATAAKRAGGQQEPRTARAVKRAIRVSPKKLNMFAHVLRRMHVTDALVQCQLSTKKTAKICFEVLQNAIANARNNFGMDANRLVVDLAYVGHGSHGKREWIHGRGRTGIRHSYRSHLTVVLKEGDTPVYTHFRKPLLERPRKHYGR